MSAPASVEGSVAGSVAPSPRATLSLDVTRDENAAPEEKDYYGRTTPRPPKEQPRLPPSTLHMAAEGKTFDPSDPDHPPIPSLAEQLEAPGGTSKERLEARSLPLGWTPLFSAARAANAEAVGALLAAGAEVNVRDAQELTPLHKAAFVGSVEICRLLLEAGAELEARDRNGRTPLHTAADSGQLGVVKHLVKRHHASQEARDGPLHDGERPYDVALRAHEHAICDFLAANELYPVRSGGGATRQVLKSEAPKIVRPGFTQLWVQPNLIGNRPGE